MDDLLLVSVLQELRNGHGDAKSSVCRAGVCQAVLHSAAPGTRTYAQVFFVSFVMQLVAQILSGYIGICCKLENHAWLLWDCHVMINYAMWITYWLTYCTCIYLCAGRRGEKNTDPEYVF